MIVHVVDAVIDVPGSLTDALEGHDVTTLSTVLEQVNLTDALESARGITIFAPIDSAFESIASVIPTLNATQISTILANHVSTIKVFEDNYCY